MKLHKHVILAIRGHKDLKKQIAKAADVTEATVYTWLKDNSDNLTKASILEIISKELELPVEQLLLNVEEEKEVEPSKVA
jgi:transcriptional regulator with XRE-family HTH domain